MFLLTLVVHVKYHLVLITSYIVYIYTGVQFSFIPSRAITIQHTAVYKCSVDNKELTIQWTVNESLSTLPSIIDLGIVTYGHGTQNSNLTIPGNPELNNTIVTCIAFELDGFTQHAVNTTNATLLIQGMVMSVVLSSNTQ